MTTIYFVRHAEPDYDNHDDLSRELSPKGLRDRQLVTSFLMDKNIDMIVSSPYKRAFDTVSEFACIKGLSINIVDDFRERRVDSGWISDFKTFTKRQWDDFTYKLSDGECLQEVQQRNIKALNVLLCTNPDQTIVVGSHGTALSTIINYFNPNYMYSDFIRIQGLMPWIVKFEFNGYECINITEYNIFETEKY